MTGKTLSHYHIVEKLGAGGMGEVYRAKDSRLARSVAIKVLTSEKVADPERKRRFVQEAKAASAHRSGEDQVWKMPAKGGEAKSS